MKRQLLRALGASFLLASPIYAQSTPVAAPEVMAIQQSQLEVLRQKLVPVGTVLQSFLPWAAFQKQAGGKWVPCDGHSSVQGTLFGTLTNRTTAPNCSGRFLRAEGGQAAPLGQLQAQDVIPHNHAASVDIGHQHQTLGYTLFDINVTWTAGNNSNHAVLKKTSANQNYTPSFVGSRTVSVGNYGVKETRPDNITVAVYIKVDN